MTRNKFLVFVIFIRKWGRLTIIRVPPVVVSVQSPPSALTCSSIPRRPKPPRRFILRDTDTVIRDMELYRVTLLSQYDEDVGGSGMLTDII